MSYTRKIIETENLFRNAYVTVLSEYQRRSKTPKERNTQSIWDLDADSYVEQDVEEYLSKSYDVGNDSFVPNMYDVKQDEVGMWLDSSVIDYSEECYTDENDLFDISSDPITPGIQMKNRKSHCSMECSSNDSHMDVNNRKESFSAENSESVSENDMELLQKTAKIDNDLENYPAKDLVFSSVNECKRDLTTPEKIISTKRQCVDTKISDTEKVSRLVRTNLDVKLNSISSKKNSLENISQLYSDVKNMKSLNENSVELPQSENTHLENEESKNKGDDVIKEKSNWRQKEFQTMSSSVGRNDVSAIEKKCSEWKTMQQKLNSHCEWRKRAFEKPFHFETGKLVEDFKSSKPDGIKNYENMKMSKSSELIDVLHNEVHVNDPDSIVYEPDKSIKSMPDHSVVNKLEPSIANKPNKSIVNKPDKSAAMNKPDKSAAMNKPDKSALNKSNICFMNRVGNVCIEKSNDLRQGNIKFENKMPVLENLPKVDDCMVNLLVIGRNRNSELVVQRQVLERVRSRYTELIPPIDSDEIAVNYSLDAIITLLRFLFSTPYNLSNWKVALEVISMAKVYKLPDLHNTCLQYLEKNFTSDELELAIEYIRHFNVIEDCKNLEVFDKIDTSSSLDNADKPRIFTPTCSISAALVIDSCEFCIPLNATQEFMGSVFEADIKNDLLFEALYGTFCITGIQIKLRSGFIGNSKKNVMYTVSKRSKTLISDTKEKPFKSLIIINFVKKVIVKRKEVVKISIMIEDIQARLCCTTPKVKLIEKTDAAHFKISLTSNKNHEKFRKPLFFIEKLFYTLSA